MNLPTRITLFRIFLIPIVIVLLISPAFWSCFLAALIFGLAAATDWLDGYLARMTNEETLLGKLLDPIADKLLVLSALIPLVELDRVSAWIVVVIIGREFAVSGLRTIAGSYDIYFAAGSIGKWKMGMEITAILFLILDFNFLFHIIGQLTIWIAMILSLISAVDYFTQFWLRINPSRIT